MRALLRLGEVVIAAVRLNGRALYYVESKELKKDREVALSAVR